MLRKPDKKVIKFFLFERIPLKKPAKIPQNAVLKMALYIHRNSKES